MKASVSHSLLNSALPPDDNSALPPDDNSALPPDDLKYPEIICLHLLKLPPSSFKDRV